MSLGAWGRARRSIPPLTCIQWSACSGPPAERCPRRLAMLRHSISIGLTLSLGLAGCSSSELDREVGTEQADIVGDTLPGLVADADLLAEAEEAFAAVESINDGVGPIFNERACGNCHSNGAMG